MQRIEIDLHRLAELHKNDIPTEAMATEFGCSLSVIHRKLKSLGLNRRSGGPSQWQRQYTDEEIVAMYRELRSTPAVAERVGCTSKTVWNILVRNGAEIRGNSGSDHSQWNGGFVTDSHGYILSRMPDHPAAVNGYVPQHRLVMERHLGRYLERREEVHHRNLDRTDNRLENLKLYACAADHMRAEHASPDRITHLVKVRKSRTDAILEQVRPLLLELVNRQKHSPHSIALLACLPSSFVGSWCRRAGCERLQGKRPVSAVTQETRKLAYQLSAILRPLVRGAKMCK